MDVAPTVPKDRFAGVDEALATLAQQADGVTHDARPSGPAADRSTDAPISQSFAAATLGPADLSAQIPREQRSLGKRGTLARVAIAVCLGVSAISAWQSYGSPARDMITTWIPTLGWISAHPSADHAPAPQTPEPEQAAAAHAVKTSAAPPTLGAPIAQPATDEPAAALADRRQIETMARDVAALRQTVKQLVGGQEQLTREIAKLQAEKAQADKPPAETQHKRTLRRVSAADRRSDVFDPAQDPNAPGVPHTLGSIVQRRGSPPAPMAPQAASQVSTVRPLLPPPPPAPQSSPMLVPQP